MTSYLDEKLSKAIANWSNGDKSEAVFWIYQMIHDLEDFAYLLNTGEEATIEIALRDLQTSIASSEHYQRFKQHREDLLNELMDMNIEMGAYD